MIPFMSPAGQICPIQSVFPDKAAGHESGFLPCPAACHASDIDPLAGTDLPVVLRDLESDRAAEPFFSQIIDLIGWDTPEMLLVPCIEDIVVGRLQETIRVGQLDAEQTVDNIFSA